MREDVADKIAAVAEKIKRWETRATRAMNALAKLRKQRARLERKTCTKNLYQEPVPPVALPEPAMVAKPAADDSLAIPGFLRRAKADQDALDKAKAEREERAKAKKQGQAERRKAQRAGETKKMPLSGKEALALINQG